MSGKILVYVFIDGTGKKIEQRLNKLGRSDCYFGKKTNTQRALDQLEKWSDRKLLKFNTGKYRVWCLR